MAIKNKNLAARCYTAFLTIIAPFYALFRKARFKTQKENQPKSVVLLIARAHDIELLFSLYQAALSRKDICLSFWIVNKCVRRKPEILQDLHEKNISVERVVGFLHLWKILNHLISVDAFLSTVESTTARHKLPYIITSLANAVGTPTFVLQHGFENVGLTYRDEIHGADVKFSSKTVFTWGPAEALPHWVENDTREKCVAAGCPKKMNITENVSLLATEGRPIIGVFDNLHWHRYDDRYISTFLSHLEEVASLYQEFRFVLKSHPDSVRNRSRDLTARLGNMKAVDVADLVGEEDPSLTTPWLLTHALGVITTPSTIALDGVLAKVPVAVTRYGLDLDYYKPLPLLDDLADWQLFLNQLKDNTGHSHLKLQGEHFLSKTLVAGDPATRILDTMVASSKIEGNK